jgi:streptomycin 3"-adenylyltransferase
MADEPGERVNAAAEASAVSRRDGLRHRLPETERAQLDAVLDLVRDVLGDAAIGAYLFGSSVTSGLRADSDLDVLIVSRRPTSDTERRRLIDGLLAVSRSRGDPTGRRHLEVTVVVRSDISPWRYPPPMEFQYGDWWRDEFTSGDIRPWTSPNPDLAVLLTAVREDAVALFGPPIDRLVDAVPRADLDRALLDVIPGLMADLEGDVRNVLLTLARVWFTLETGTISSKDVAADWAITRLPPGRGDAIRLARAGYLGKAQDRWDSDEMAIARADAATIREAILRA